MSNENFVNPDIELQLAELDECICSKIGDGLKVGDIDQHLRGSMPEFPDDVFSDEDASVMDTVRMPGSNAVRTDEQTIPESYAKC